MGISILHHIDLSDGSKELRRVLKPGGKAYFIEPLGESRLQNALRKYVFRVHHGHVRTVDAEHPLTYDDIRAFGAAFQTTEFREFQLTEMVARVTGDGFTRALALDRLDESLLHAFPGLRRLCRLVVITYQK